MMIDVTDPSQAQPSGHRPVLVKWSTRRRTRVIDGRRPSGARDANTARVMCDGLTDSGPSPIGHGPIELDSNIWIWLQRTPVAVAVVSLAVMCSYGPDKLLGAFE